MPDMRACRQVTFGRGAAGSETALTCWAFCSSWLCMFATAVVERASPSALFGASLADIAVTFLPTAAATPAAAASIGEPAPATGTGPGRAEA